jgi:hypothetical protein
VNTAVVRWQGARADAVPSAVSGRPRPVCLRRDLHYARLDLRPEPLDVGRGELGGHRGRQAAERLGLAEDARGSGRLLQLRDAGIEIDAFGSGIALCPGRGQ